MNTPHRQAARSRGQRLSVDRAGLGSTGERGRAIPDIPAVLREHPGQAGGRTKGSLGEPPEDRPACARGDLVVVAMLYRGVVVSRIARVERASPLLVRARMGKSPWGDVRWSPLAREPLALRRPATAREAATGVLAT